MSAEPHENIFPPHILLGQEARRRDTLVQSVNSVEELRNLARYDV